jgi:hypothetical protein
VDYQLVVRLAPLVPWWVVLLIVVGVVLVLGCGFFLLLCLVRRAYLGLALLISAILTALMTSGLEVGDRLRLPFFYMRSVLGWLAALPLRVLGFFAALPGRALGYVAMRLGRSATAEERREEELAEEEAEDPFGDLPDINGDLDEELDHSFYSAVAGSRQSLVSSRFSRAGSLPLTDDDDEDQLPSVQTAEEARARALASIRANMRYNRQLVESMLYSDEEDELE